MTYTWWTWVHNGVLWGTTVWACNQIVEIIFPGKGYWDPWSWLLPLAVGGMQLHGLYILLSQKQEILHDQDLEEV